MADLTIKKDHAEIYELKNRCADTPNNENTVRVYRSSKGDGVKPDEFVLQIRTHKPIDERQKGKARNMIATVTINADELKEILEYSKKC